MKVKRLTQVINPQGERTSYSYDAAGRRTLKKLANGSRTSFSYNAASRITSMAEGWLMTSMVSTACTHTARHTRPINKALNWYFRQR